MLLRKRKPTSYHEGEDIDRFFEGKIVHKNKRDNGDVDIFLINKKTKAEEPWVLVRDSVVFYNQLNVDGSRNKGLFLAKSQAEETIIGKFEGRVLQKFKKGELSKDSEIINPYYSMQLSDGKGNIKLIDTLDTYLGRMNDPRGNKCGATENVVAETTGIARLLRRVEPYVSLEVCGNDLDLFLKLNCNRELLYDYGEDYTIVPLDTFEPQSKRLKIDRPKIVPCTCGAAAKAACICGKETTAVTTTIRKLPPRPIVRQWDDPEELNRYRSLLYGNTKQILRLTNRDSKRGSKRDKKKYKNKTEIALEEQFISKTQEAEKAEHDADKQAELAWLLRVMYNAMPESETSRLQNQKLNKLEKLEKAEQLALELRARSIKAFRIAAEAGVAHSEYLKNEANAESLKATLIARNKAERARYMSDLASAQVVDQEIDETSEGSPWRGQAYPISPEQSPQSSRQGSLQGSRQESRQGSRQGSRQVSRQSSPQVSRQGSLQGSRQGSPQQYTSSDDSDKSSDDSDTSTSGKLFHKRRVHDYRMAHPRLEGAEHAERNFELVKKRFNSQKQFATFGNGYGISGTNTPNSVKTMLGELCEDATSEDVFTDLGSGEGWVTLFAAALYPRLRSTFGIEVNPDAVVNSIENRIAVGFGENCRFFEKDLTKMDNLANTTLLYTFNVGMPPSVQYHILRLIVSTPSIRRVVFYPVRAQACNIGAFVTDYLIPHARHECPYKKIPTKMSGSNTTHMAYVFDVNQKFRELAQEYISEYQKDCSS